MTPRENLLHFLKHEPYEWTPTSRDQVYFHPAEIPDHVARAMIFQQEPYTGPKGGKDKFGVDWVFVPTVGGSMETAPLFDDITEWKSHISMPDLDQIDWEGCARRNAKFLSTDKAIHSSIYTGFFERLISFVGFENASIALIDDDEKEAVHELFEQLTELYIEEIRRLKKWFHLDILELHDDWGNQRSLMFSVETHTEMILPYVKRVIDAAHAMDVCVEQHSCGKIEELMPNLIASGADTWRGQNNVVNKKWLVDHYGDQFRFGVDVQFDPDTDPADYAAAADRFLQDYHGKDIWLIASRAPQAKAFNEVVFARLAKLGRI